MNATKIGRTHVRSMAIRQCLRASTSPIGMSRVDLATALKITPDEASRTLNCLHFAGTVYSLGKARDMRYFATAVARDAATEAYAAFLAGVVRERRDRKEAAHQRSATKYKAKAKAERAERRATGLLRKKSVLIGTRRVKILAMLNECNNPLGMNSWEIIARSPVRDNSIAKTLRDMRDDGQLFTAGPNRETRFFATADARDAAIPAIEAYLQRMRDEFAERKRQRKAKSNRDQWAKEKAERAAKPIKPKAATKPRHKQMSIKLAKPKAPKAVGRPFKDLPVVNAGQVKPKVLPGFTGDRWGVSGKVIGGFASAGIGRYLEIA